MSSAASAPSILPILDWTEKHRPRKLDELVGNGPAIKALKDWAEEWREGMPKERAAVLAGEPGVGKTSAAHALANDMGWGVIELNASDTRNEEVIRRIAGSGAVNRAFGADGTFSLQAKGRQLVILDEADNLFGREDRGGMKAILDTIREAKQPIVLIANDLYELQRRGASLKTLARTIKFSKVHSNSIPPAMRRIAKVEGITLEPGVDKALSERAGGDLRSAVNDLQALATGRDHISLEDVEALGRRDTTGDVWGLMGKVFYGSDADEARRAAWDLDETPENLALWIDENLPVMYTDKRDLVEGYRYLSKASQFLGRVQRRQQYGLWSYASELMTGGVAVAKHQRPKGARFQFPTWLRRMSTFRSVRELRGRTAEKVGAVLHTSKRRAWQDIFPYLKTLMQSDDQFAAWAAWQFDLEADELGYLLDAKSTSAKVKKTLEQAAKTYEVPARVLREGEGGGAGSFGRFASADDANERADESANEPEPDPAKPSQAKLEPEADEAPEEGETEAASAEEPAKKQRSLFEF